MTPEELPFNQPPDFTDDMRPAPPLDRPKMGYELQPEIDIPVTVETDDDDEEVAEPASVELGTPANGLELGDEETSTEEPVAELAALPEPTYNLPAAESVCPACGGSHAKYTELVCTDCRATTRL